MVGQGGGGALRVALGQGTKTTKTTTRTARQLAEALSIRDEQLSKEKKRLYNSLEQLSIEANS
jgi:hypothetical protein